MGKKKCICDELHSKVKSSVDIVEYSSGPYVDLTMELGRITAHGEDNAYTSIKYCPFCGRKFNLNENNKTI